MPMPTADRMFKAVKRAQERMRWVRDRRAMNQRYFVGPYYGVDAGTLDEAKGNKRSPVGLIYQAVRNHTAALSPSKIRNHFTAKRRMLSGEALKVAASCDHVWDTQDLCRQVIAPCIKDAMLGGLGICMVGQKAGSDQLDVEGASVRLGDIFVERIDLDDWIIDPTARTWPERLFEGHRYRVPLDYALDSGIFAGKEDMLQKLPKVGENRPNRYTGVDLFSKIQADDREPLIDQVELIDLIVYHGNGATEVTISAELMDEPDYLMEREYSGPLGGRYEYLWFEDVPNNTIPLPIVNPIIDLHIGTDRAATKMLRQLAKAKTTFAYNRVNTDDAQALIDAPDQEAVGVDDANSIKQLELGGVMEGFYQAFPWLMENFNNASANSQAVGGEGQLGDGTAAEAEIINTNMNRIQNAKHGMVDNFCTGISKKIADYLINDPLIQLPVTVRIAGGENVDLQYDAESRRGTWQDFNYDIAATRGEVMDPAVKARRIIELITEAAPAAAQLAMSTGADFMGIMRTLCNLADCPEMAEYFNDPVVMQQVQQQFAAVDQQYNQGVPVPPGGQQLGQGGPQAPQGPPPTPGGSGGMTRRGAVRSSRQKGRAKAGAAY